MGIALRHHNERREARSEVNIPATLVEEGVGTPVTIKNISSYGALLDGRSVPTIGSQVTIITDRHELWATVIWTRDGQCGVLLSQPLDVGTLGVPNPLTKITKASIHALMAR
ncbi:MAG TPA: PilZ domain-containing protein [Sphingobium sp.]|nr:PilZ domain-containing protein [Sphingobium sp.]